LPKAIKWAFEFRGGEQGYDDLEVFDKDKILGKLGL